MKITIENQAISRSNSVKCFPYWCQLISPPYYTDSFNGGTFGFWWTKIFFDFQRFQHCRASNSIVIGFYNSNWIVPLPLSPYISPARLVQKNYDVKKINNFLPKNSVLPEKECFGLIRWPIYLKILAIQNLSGSISK